MSIEKFKVIVYVPESHAGAVKEAGTSKNVPMIASFANILMQHLPPALEPSGNIQEYLS